MRRDGRESVSKRLAAIVAVLMLSAGGAVAGSEADVNARIDQVLGDHAIYETAIEAFQQAVRDGRKADVAAFIRYPIRVEIDGRKRTIRSSRAFVRDYDEIMTPDIVAAVKSQKYADLFVNDRGIMFGDGEVWVNGICLDRGCKRFVPQVETIQHTGGK
jgi:hypothetical protein